MPAQLFPEQTQYSEPWQQGQVICRPPPAGGCITLVKYDRWMSNRLREFGPFDRILDRSRFVQDLTLDEVYGVDRFGISVHTAIMGVAEEERFDFQDINYPMKGMDCPAED